jgi:hypothetical protein
MIHVIRVGYEKYEKKTNEKQIEQQPSPVCWSLLVIAEPKDCTVTCCYRFTLRHATPSCRGAPLGSHSHLMLCSFTP